MKIIAKVSAAIVCISAITSMSYAAQQGGYVGVGLGYASVEKPDINQPRSLPKSIESSTLSGSNANSVAGRIFVGYNFNKNFGVEFGLAKYPNVKRTFSGKYKETNALIVNPADDITGLDGSKEIKTSSFDLVGKGYLPLSDSGLNLYALAGLAIVNMNKEVKWANTSSVTTERTYNVHGETTDTYGITHDRAKVTHENSNVINSNSRNKNKSVICPIYGVGISYDISKTKFVTNLEYSRLQGSSGSGKAPNINMCTINVAYKFG